MEAQHPLHPRRNVRLDTLVRLRWLAVGGQTAAVLVVHYVFDFTLPLTACLLVIGCSAALNLALRLRFRPIERLEPDRAAWLLAFDIVQLASLLYLTGGVENPFVFLFLGPVLIAATALPPRMTLMLGALAAACATALVFFHLPLPWVSDEPLTLPPMYLLGVWFSLLVVLELERAIEPTSRARARHPALHHRGRGARARARDRADLAPCRGHQVVARAGPALPRDSRQADPALRLQRAVRPLQAFDADRGSGRPTPQFRRRYRRGAARRPRRRAGRGAQPGDHLRVGQSRGERRRFRARAGRNRGALERQRGDDLDRRRRAGLRPGDYRPHRRALSDQSQPRGGRRGRGCGPGARRVHRQDPARAQRSGARLCQSRRPGARRGRPGALAPRGLRAGGPGNCR